MLRQQQSLEREEIIAHALGGFVRELRLVDPLDLATFLRLELISNLSDIVRSAAELHFAPEFIVMGQGGSAVVDWSEPLAVDLDLVMQPAGATVNFTLRMLCDTAEVRLAYISFDNPSEDAEYNTQFLRQAISKYSIMPKPAWIAPVTPKSGDDWWPGAGSVSNLPGGVSSRPGSDETTPGRGNSPSV